MHQIHALALPSPAMLPPQASHLGPYQRNPSANHAYAPRPHLDLYHRNPSVNNAYAPQPHLGLYQRNPSVNHTSAPRPHLALYQRKTIWGESYGKSSVRVGGRGVSPLNVLSLFCKNWLLISADRGACGEDLGVLDD